jgi:hypothetical protein
VVTTKRGGQATENFATIKEGHKTDLQRCSKKKLKSKMHASHQNLKLIKIGE